MKSIQGLLGGVLTAVLFFAATTLPGVAKADGMRFAVYSGTENTCLDVKDYSTSPGGIVQTYPCTGATNQLWSAEVFSYGTDGSELMHLVNVGSGLCLDLVYAGTNAGIGLLQAPCNGSATQVWKLTTPILAAVSNYVTDYAPKLYRNLINNATGLCPRANGGAQVTQEVCGDDRAKTSTSWRMPIF